MKFLGIISATFGRLLLPLRNANGASTGEVYVDANRLKYIDNSPSPTERTVLTDQDLGAPSGVAPLGATGIIPAQYLPPSTPGSTASGVPIGTFLPWGGDPRGTLPTGYLPCAGDEVFQADFPDLFAVFGHRYGVPSDYSLKFRLPNFIGRSVMGSPDGNDMAAGQVHKVVVRNPGIGFPTSTTITASLNSVGSAIITTPVSVRLVTNASGGVERVDVLDGGLVSGIVLGESTNSMGASSVNLLINPTVGASQFSYDIIVSPVNSGAQSWGVRLTNKGEGYSSTPSVTITGPSLTGATAVAVMEGARIREVIVTNPGVGDPTGATVAFSGGAPSTPATGSVLFWTSPIAFADYGGEQQHVQTTAELVAHTHTADISDEAGNSSRFASGAGAPEGTATTDSRGGGAPFPLLPPYLGVLIIVRAV